MLVTGLSLSGQSGGVHLGLFIYDFFIKCRGENVPGRIG